MADANEELEYHVTFPTAISTDLGEGGFANSDLPDTKEPVVVLLGWLGCEDRYLSKYSAIYHSIGFTTIRYTVPKRAMYSPKVKTIARKILELVYDLGLEENVVFFHIFSNGGCFLYRYITQFLHNPTVGGEEFATIKIGGCIFDSTPCTTNLLLALKLRNRSDTTSGILMRIVNAIAFLLLAFLSFFLPPNHSWNVRQGSLISAMKNDPSSYPQLFLYSKADGICDWRGVEAVVEARRQKQVEVQQVCWEDSPHCRHLLTHREEYIKNCQDFVQECLRNYVDEASD